MESLITEIVFAAELTTNISFLCESNAAPVGLVPTVMVLMTVLAEEEIR